MGKLRRTRGLLRCSMSSARPLFVHESGRKGMPLVEDGTLLGFATFKDLQVSVK